MFSQRNWIIRHHDLLSGINHVDGGFILGFFGCLWNFGRIRFNLFFSGLISLDLVFRDLISLDLSPLDLSPLGVFSQFFRSLPIRCRAVKRLSRERTRRSVRV